jgi:predicted nucleic-acid-binding protein
MKRLPILDTNLIIRFLTGDSVVQARKVRDLLKNSSKGSLEISDVVLAEIVYVLTSVYGLSRADIVEKISLLIELDSIACNKRLLRKTLDLFNSFPISFIDAYLSALVLTEKNTRLYTFDRKLLKILSKGALEP